MNDRLWYSQFDVHDCVRRFGALISAYSEAPGVERLCIADFYLANPPLLHGSRMTQEMRRSFGRLQIPRPQHAFLTYPAPVLLFKKMEPVEKEALRAMGGKGLLSIKELNRGVARLTDAGEGLFVAAFEQIMAAAEGQLVRFLVNEFAGRSEVGSEELRRSTGLRRAG